MRPGYIWPEARRIAANIAKLTTKDEARRIAVTCSKKPPDRMAPQNKYLSEDRKFSLTGLST